MALGRFHSPHPFPLAAQLFGVVVGVNALTGCGIRGCWGVRGCADFCWGEGAELL